MIKYEIRKFISHRFFFLMLMVCVIVDLACIQGQIISRDSVQEQAVYETIRGKMTYKNVQDFVQEYTNMDSGDPRYGIYVDEYDDLKYAYTYEAYADTIVKRAVANTENPYQTIYDKRWNEDVVKRYSNRSIPGYYHMDEERQLMEYDFSQGMILILLILGMPYVVLNEKQGNMDQLLPVCRHGTWRVRLGKILFAAMMGCFLTGLFGAADLMGFSLFGNLDGLGEPLYAIAKFADTPAGGSVLSCFIQVLLFRMLGNICISFLILLMAYLLGNTFRVFLGSALLVILFVVLGIYTGFPFNPLLLADNAELIHSYAAVNVLDHPVLKRQMLAAVFGMVNVLLALGMVRGKKCAVIQ